MRLFMFYKAPTLMALRSIRRKRWSYGRGRRLSLAASSAHTTGELFISTKL